MHLEITIRIDVGDLTETAKPAKMPAPVAPEPLEAKATIFHPGRLMRLHEVMTYLKATRDEIDAFVGSGRLPKPIRRGRGLLFPSDDVRLLMMNLRAAELRRSSE